MKKETPHTFRIIGRPLLLTLHLLKYDRSGRSSGVAFITYETPAEAAQAKREFDGKFAKGVFLSLSPLLSLSLFITL